jgi:hypothetical protein
VSDDLEGCGCSSHTRAWLRTWSVGALVRMSRLVGRGGVYSNQVHRLIVDELRRRELEVVA